MKDLKGFSKMEADNELILKNEVYVIIGAAMDVYNELKPGFLEAVYQEALTIEFTERAIPFLSQPRLSLYYKDHEMNKYYVGDFLVYGQIIVEIKALEVLTSREEAQLLNQLKAAKAPLGLLINFGHPHNLEWKRMAHTKLLNIRAD
jgi:GxxExxY protein